MADGIGRIIGGGSNFGVGGNVPQRKGSGQEEDVSQVPVNNYEQVDPSKVMDFLAQNNMFVNLTNAPEEAMKDIIPDPTLQARVDGYMQNFERIYGIVEQEFGPELAPVVMDMVMDRLMGLVD